jgi:uncharacterized protein (TIGR04222 family)
MIKTLVDFYFPILVVLAVAGYFVAQRLAAPGTSSAAKAPAFDYRDPYLIAALRGGPRAVIELAVVALLDRGLLESAEATFDGAAHIKVGREDAVEFAANDVERALLTAATSKVAVRHAVTAVQVKAAGEAYARRLIALGLKLDAAEATRRRAILVACLLPVVVVVILRVVLPKHVALFHVALGLVVLLITGAIARAKRNERGKAILKELKDLFAGLSARAAELRRGRMSSDAVFCGAAFGLASLPALEYPAAAHFSEEERKRRSDNSGDSGGGSSCGFQNCGSSDGGGGGGGDGGGGGGCGGGGE